MAEPTGLHAALRDQLADAALPDEEQIEMEEIAQLPLLGDVIRDGRPIAPGRPKGALNKSTRALAEYVLARHRHPVIAAAQICDMPLADLARAMACEKLDAAKYQQTCREFVARYTLQAMPQSVQVDMGTVGMLYVINQAAPKPGETLSPFGIDIQLNQSLSDGDTEKSHDEKSHGSE